MNTCDIFFITYDEPNAEASWKAASALVPGLKRVHGVKGFNAAYRRCAEEATTPRFFTVDGDNIILPSFLELEFEAQAQHSNSVYSWPSINSINALCYGNGGIKNWPTEATRNMRTHEDSGPGVAVVDFCFELNYFQMPSPLSLSKINHTAYQAFRAGFREGVKMCLERGMKPPQGPIRAHVSAENLNRLRIWCSVGLDQEFGEWAIYGARLGCQKITLSDWNYSLIRDYDWFQKFWQEEIESKAPNLSQESSRLAEELNRKIDLGILTLDQESSQFFKSVYVNPQRNGLMFK